MYFLCNLKKSGASRRILRRRRFPTPGELEMISLFLQTIHGRFFSPGWEERGGSGGFEPHSRSPTTTFQSQPPPPTPRGGSGACSPAPFGGVMDGGAEAGAAAGAGVQPAPAAPGGVQPAPAAPGGPGQPAAAQRKVVVSMDGRVVASMDSRRGPGE